MRRPSVMPSHHPRPPSHHQQPHHPHPHHNQHQQHQHHHQPHPHHNNNHHHHHPRDPRVKAMYNNTTNMHRPHQPPIITQPLLPAFPMYPMPPPPHFIPPQQQPLQQQQQQQQQLNAGVSMPSAPMSMRTSGGMGGGMMPPQSLSSMPSSAPNSSHRPHHSSSSSAQPPHQPSHMAALRAARESNACEKLIHVARSMRARPVYDTQRVGGEDHSPLFKSLVVIPPLNYTADGTGGSKMASRRAAAACLLRLLADRNVYADQSSQGEDGELVQEAIATAGVKTEPKLDNRHTAKPVKSHFYVDRVPDPHPKPEPVLASTSTTTTTATTPSSATTPVTNPNSLSDSPSDLPSVPRRSTPNNNAGNNKNTNKSATVVKTENGFHPPTNTTNVPSKKRLRSPSPSARPTSTTTNTSAAPQPPPPSSSSSKSPTKASTPAKLEPDSDIKPPRKRSKTFGPRMRMLLYCENTPDTVSKLKELAAANLYVDFTITMVSRVDSPKYVLLGRNVAAEVHTIPEALRPVDNAQLVALAAAIGEKKDALWVERAKHLQQSASPISHMPRLIVVHHNQALKCLTVDNVIEIVSPAHDLVKYVQNILDEANAEE